MRIIRAADYNKLSRQAANHIISCVKNHSEAVLGLATGSTPEATYQLLIQDYQEQGTCYRQIKTVNLDEYVGIPSGHMNSYYMYMKKQLFDHIDILDANTHIPDGMSADIEQECHEYDQLIEGLGGIDLQVLGIGTNGHIGFNEPGTPFSAATHIVELTDSTRSANARFFQSFDHVPTHAITMGIQSIMKSKEIILLASGVNKASAIARLLNGEISEDFPASSLHMHPNVTLIADAAALSLIDGDFANEK